MLKKHFMFLAFSAITLSACSDIHLTGLSAEKVNATSAGEFCTYDPSDKIAYTNYLFIIDFSGSNGQTDRKRIRVQKALKFYNEKKDQPYIRWGAMTFDSDAKAIIYQSSDKEPIFSDDPAIVDQGMQRLQKKSQNGSATNYSDAIDMARDAIQNDISINKGRDDYYMIFFLTDGQPNQGTTSTGGLVGKVKDLVGLKAGRIFFSAAYYGKEGDPDKLRQMAQAGGGRFAIIDKTDDLNFTDLLTGPQKEAWVLKKDSFFVYNLNSAICDTHNGDFAADSDGDGVCDDDEIYYNKMFPGSFDPTKRSTPQLDAKTGQFVDTGYSDYFILQEKKGLIILPKCDPAKRTDNDNDLLNDCEEALLHNDTPSGTQYGDTTWKTGNPVDPDTDNDGIIDGLEAFLFRNHLGWALDNRVDKPWSGENISALKKVQMHKNPLLADRSPAYDTVITPIATENGKTCYSFSQDSLTLYPTQDVKVENVHPMLARGSNQNSVLVYFVQTKFSDPNGKGIFMYSVQQLDVNANYQNGLGTPAGLQVNDRVFKPYETYLKVGN